MPVDSPELRERIVKAAELLFRSGVMSHSGHGNMSARIDDETMLLTSTGNLRSLNTESLVIVRFDGSVLMGSLDSVTAEIIPMHAKIYEQRESVGAITHTHSPHVTAFALANKPLPCSYESMLRHGLAEPVPVAKWAPRGSRESVDNILDAIASRPTVPAVLLGNHGLLAFSSEPVRTSQLIIAMEEGAEMMIEAAALGGAEPFPEGALERELEHMRRFGSQPT
jgi:L-ribulose-5-phosphate 4-epimerase